MGTLIMKSSNIFKKEDNKHVRICLKRRAGINSKGRILDASVAHSLLQAEELMQKYLICVFSHSISDAKNTLYLPLSWIIPKVCTYIFLMHKRAN